MNLIATAERPVAIATRSTPGMRSLSPVAQQHCQDTSWRRMWYTVEEVAQCLGLSLRTVRDRLTEVPQNCVRPETGITGRPRNLYHYKALPGLATWHLLNVDANLDASDPTPDPEAKPATPPAADDMAMAELRAMAVEDYLTRAKDMPKENAAKLTVMDWQYNRKSRTRRVDLVERLDGGHQRRRQVEVAIDSISVPTLRRWASTYQSTKATHGLQAAILALLPERKGRSGRTAREIPGDLITFFTELWQFNDRTSAAAALERMQSEIPEDLRDVSLTTWMRRAREMDPHGARRDANHSIARYRRRQLPQVEIEWNDLAYNDRWELDDVQMDWWALGDAYTWLRPYGYAIIRVSTRQWVAFVSTATPPTHEDVRALIGFAMTSPLGGVPKHIHFERGTVACKADLEQLLTLLGVQVSRSSVDRGPVLPGMAPDSPRGNPRGKSVNEANNRRLHMLAQFASLQVGSDERHTAPARLEAQKTMMVELARKYAGEMIATGRQPVEPSNMDWMQLQMALAQKHNDHPHSGLPKIIDPETGRSRHMTPNERAAQILPDAGVNVLDEQLLMRFVLEPKVVPVNPKTGITLNGYTYGRFDDQLVALPEVTVFGHPWCPEKVYIKELGRVVKMYRKAAFGDHEQLGDAKRQEFKFRNNRMALLAKAAEAGHGEQLQTMFMPQAPTAGLINVIRPAELANDVDAMRAAFDQAQRQDDAAKAQFDLPPDTTEEPTDEAPRPRRGITARADEISQQITNNTHMEEPEI